MDEPLDDYYWEVVDLAADYDARGLDDPDPGMEVMARNAPAEAAANMLCAHALGDWDLTDEQVAHLWAVTFAEGYDARDTMPDDVLARARPERRTRPPQPVRHPLKGGGHGSGRGLPGKTEYPARWTDGDAIDFVMSVAREPDGAVTQPDGTFRAWATRDGVDLRVILTADGDLLTAYPVAGDGVIRNALDDVRKPYLERLYRLIETVELDGETRAGMDELIRVGEWDRVVAQLRALPVPPDQQEELAALAAAADLRPPP